MPETYHNAPCQHCGLPALRKKSRNEFNLYQIYAHSCFSCYYCRAIVPLLSRPPRTPLLLPLRQPLLSPQRLMHFLQRQSHLLS